MKVFVMTKAVPLGPEIYVGVKKTRKEALKTFRELFPHMREKSGGMVSDSSNTFLLFIHEEEI